MMHFIAKGILSGAIGALVAALTETLLGNGGPFVATFFVATGLLLPVGMALGVGLILLLALLPEPFRPQAVLGKLLSKSDCSTAAGVLTWGLLSLVSLPFIYKTIFFFLTTFNHHGLAAMALTATLLAVCTTILLLGRRIHLALIPTWGRVSNRQKWLARPLIPLLLVGICWLGVVAPPLVKGPEAQGIYGFIGFLRKDGLGAGPLISLAGMSVIALITFARLTPKVPGKITLISLISLFISCINLFAAGQITQRIPQTLERLDTAAGLSPIAGKLIRKLGDADKDGHARWMGGKDCDDSNNQIYPGARELPDNDIDEDCSGEDLKLDELRAAVAEQHTKTQAPSQKLTLPEFPEDVSVFLITVDTFRWDSPGFMGYERNITPNLDKLVENGTIYTRAYALGSYTGQSIPPFFTGKYASELLRNDRHELRVSGKETFAAELICNDSIKCKGILSHFLFQPHFGWNQGFQEWSVVGASPSGPGHIDSKYNSHAVANQAIKWLKNPQNTEGRFFLWTHFMDPHKEYLDHKGFKRFGDDRRSRYDHEVLFTDHHIGRMLDFFYTLPAAERTIFIVTGDHGEAFNEHGRWCHGKELWEEIIRVPMAVAGPGIPQKTIHRQTSHIDMFPTLLALFNQKIPEGIHGRSLLPDWVEGQELEEVPVIADQPLNPNYETRRVFLKNGWKLHHLPDTGGYRLFKITDDYERSDSLVETHPEEFKSIKNAYELFLATQFKSVPTVKYSAGNVDRMPLPDGYQSHETTDN